MKIEIEIEPMNEKWCGQCPMLMVWGFGTSFGCRIFSEEIGGDRSNVLRFDEKNCVMRHPKCVEVEHTAAPNLLQEVERLQALVKEAYFEGYREGNADSPYGIYSPVSKWKRSYTRHDRDTATGEEEEVE